MNFTPVKIICIQSKVSVQIFKEYDIIQIVSTWLVLLFGNQ